MLRNFISALPSVIALAVCGALSVSCLDLSRDPEPVYDRAMILNSGGNGVHGSVTTVDEETFSSRKDMYSQVNGETLGGEAVSFTISDYMSMYIICRNPGKIVMVDPVTMRELSTVKEAPEDPFAMYAYTSKLFVLDRTEEGVMVRIYDLTDNRLVASEKVVDSATDVYCSGSKLFVTSASGIVVYDITSLYTGTIKYKGVIVSEHPCARMVYVSESAFLVSLPGAGVAKVDVLLEKMDPVMETVVGEDGFITTDGQFSKAYTYSDDGVYSLDVSKGSYGRLMEMQGVTSISQSPFTGNFYIGVEKDGKTYVSVRKPSGKDEIASIETGSTPLKTIFFMFR